MVKKRMLSTLRYVRSQPFSASSWPQTRPDQVRSGWVGVSRAGRLSNPGAPRTARLPIPKPTTINLRDSRCERGTTEGQATALLQPRTV